MEKWEVGRGKGGVEWEVDFGLRIWDLGLGRVEIEMWSRSQPGPGGAPIDCGSMVPEPDRLVAAGEGGSAADAATVEIGREVEDARGWRFEVAVARPGIPVSRHEVTLSWVDYEYWSHGQLSPSRVAECVMRALLSLRPGLALPARFDASTCRRWARGLDERMHEG